MQVAKAGPHLVAIEGVAGLAGWQVILLTPPQVH
jgi:hypothetical protein